jgi:hypothetical protein
VLPRRWVVQRAFARIYHDRRMAKDHEKLCATGGLRLGGDGGAYGEAIGSYVGVSRQCLYEADRRKKRKGRTLSNSVLS